MTNSHFAPSSLAGRKVSIIVRIVGIVAMRTALGGEREYSDGVRDGWGSGQASGTARPFLLWRLLSGPRCRPSTRNITAQKSAPHCGQVKRIGKRCKFLTGSGGGKDKVAEMRACADKQ
jgi:hypothetical protein